MSERTIRNDLRILQGNCSDNEIISVCGKRFVIPEEDIQKSKGTYNFASTIHPLFLTENLTQVITMLKGLHYMETRPEFFSYARNTAIDIWSQLSDYAKERILFVSKEIISENSDWFELLNEEYELRKDKISFYFERDCSNMESCGIILKAIKNEEPFFVLYESNDGLRVYCDCKFVPHSYTQKEIKVITNEQAIDLEFNRVIRSSFSKDDLV